MEVHPCLKLVPEMPGDLFQRLKEDVSGLGVINPIVLLEGKILDGRARYRACQELGIECPVRSVENMSPSDCVRSMNVYRRHLSEDQQVEIRQQLIEIRY
ncbi:MAG: ParB N-terminal domain-containing protein [Desulfobacteraceae bacterium]|nr:ParB N-terminal domain-containing protein [Desulfobacteraceae bacterium]